MSTETNTSGTASSNGSRFAPGAEVMTLTEAAEFLRVSGEGLRRDADAGNLPGRLVAGEWRFVKDALLAWLSAATDHSSRPTHPSELPHGVIRKSLPSDLNAGLLASIGAFEDDETLEPMIEQIYRERKANPVGG